MIHKITLEWDDEMELACIAAQCPCETCTELVDILALTMEGVGENVEVV